MSNLVLYRKYRPVSFSDVVSQDHVKTTLRNAVAHNRAGHAYLFTGPRGVGKTTIARIFARAVNCLQVAEGEPCNNCDICKDFLGGTSLDILEIDAASHTGVDNIRELIDHLQFAPTRAKYKVIIIDEVHMLSKGAFNALLKTLEEPPAHAIFILATTEIHKVPATIVSRTQRFDFKKASMENLVQRLKFVCADNQVEAEDEALIVIAQAADGSFRDGLSLLDQVLNFANGKLTVALAEDVLGLTSLQTSYDFLSLILAGENKQAVDFISKLMYSGKDLIQFQKDFLEYLRKILIIKVGARADFGFSQEMQSKLLELVSRVPLEKLVRIIELFQRAGSEIKWSVIQSLPMELAAIEAINIKDNVAIGTISNEVRDLGTNTETSPRQSSDRSGNSHDNPEGLQKIAEAWPKILDKLKEYNHSLIPSLKLAKAVALQGRELVITFPYKFHKDAVEQRKNKIVVDQVIEEVTGMKLMIKPVVEKDWKGEPVPLSPQTENEMPPPGEPVEDNLDNNLMESALKIMGGEVET
ncbi:MAG: DNA polymerase III subunit gamma/tau [Candidatus Doudnabacteria bacterium]|nr:DNA polymerase III subunit gamma/tau [Candidatus Doudnabacteria bacterium]